MGLGKRKASPLHTDQVRKVLGPIVGQAVRDRDEPPDPISRIPTLTGVVIAKRFVRYVDITSAYDTLDSQSRAIIERRFAIDLTVEHCAMFFRLSEPTIRKRIKDALDVLIDIVLVGDEEYDAVATP